MALAATVTKRGTPMQRNPCSRTATAIIFLMVATGIAACSTEIEKAEQRTDDRVAAKSDQPAPPATSGEGSEVDARTVPAAPALVRDLSASTFRLRHSEAQSGGVMGFAPPSQMRGPITERYAHFDNAGIRRTASDPISTFSIDVDTGSYANIRRFLKDGALPPADAVRIEEMINYFRYSYAGPEDRSRPFSVSWDLMTTPWNPKTHLLRLGLKGFEPATQGDRPPANLVFLLDVSGSMQPANKLPLMVRAMRLLTAQLDERDRVAIVVYAGNSGLVLESTPGDKRATILAALDKLQAGGSTAGGEGIELAYSIALQGHIEGGINRVILATDGDFNVGVVNIEALKDIIARKRKQGISLTTLGFGTGNLNDALLEQLADVGDGNYAYIDSLMEARKVLVEQASGTLLTIARDVKIQVEFNPAVVAEYRLIGYENRVLAAEDFANDKVDAGEIGSGHTVTALYEIALVDSGGEKMPPLRYGDEAAATAQGTRTDEFAYVKLRYKPPAEEASLLIEFPLPTSAFAALTEASPDLSFAAAVAAFGQHLRQSPHLGDFGIDEMIALANEGVAGGDRFYRAEFVKLLELAKAVN